MIGQAVRKAHIPDLPDPVFTRFASFDIYSKVNCAGIFSWQVAYNMAGVESLAGAFHFCITLLGLVPAFGLTGMAEEMLVFYALRHIQVPDGLFGTFYPSFQHFVTRQAHHKTRVVVICQLIKCRTTEPSICPDSDFESWTGCPYLLNYAF